MYGNRIMNRIMQSLVSLTFDDGLRCQFEKAVPILKKFGFLATFFLIANQDPTHERWNHANEWWKIDWRPDDITMLREVTHGGHEIGSHSVSHHQETMRARPEREASTSKQLIEDWLGIKVSSFCYPYYRSHAYLANAVRKAGYEQARGGGKPPLYGPQAPYYPMPNIDIGSFDQFNVGCREVSNNENVAGWLQPGCWHVLTFHGIGSDEDGWRAVPVELFRDQMKQLADFRDSGAAEVVSFQEGARRFRQVK
jgi:peptidoglycan/xylan/chitin deacetylase (PgdA/CDA1 family)